MVSLHFSMPLWKSSERPPQKIYKKSYLWSRMETKYSALDVGRSDSFLEKTAPALGFYFLF